MYYSILQVGQFRYNEYVHLINENVLWESRVSLQVRFIACLERANQNWGITFDLIITSRFLLRVLNWYICIVCLYSGSKL